MKNHEKKLPTKKIFQPMNAGTADVRERERQRELTGRQNRTSSNTEQKRRKLKINYIVS